MHQEARLALAEKDLAAAQAELDEKQREKDEVQAQYDAAIQKKEMLTEDAETCRRKMNAATALISGLSGERERWTQQSKEFQEQIGRYEPSSSFTVCVNQVFPLLQSCRRCSPLHGILVVCWTL